MKFNLRSLLPKNPAEFVGLKFTRLLTVLYLLVVVVRSCIHLFAADGGAQSIAGIDVSVEGGNNIIAIFHQWGAIQLLLVSLQILLFFRYPGLTPLVLVTLAADPVLRAISGQIMHVTSTKTPPGAALDWPAFYLVLVVLLFSLIERSPRKILD